MLALLEALARSTGGRSHKVNLIGRPYQRGSVENLLGRELSAEERGQFGRAFEELKRADLIRPDYGDLSDPENWVDITELGRRALAGQVIDEVDEMLQRIDGHLLEIREGAWARLESETADSLRQAADAMRELIDQTLHFCVDDVNVVRASWFKPDPSSKNGVTRAHRARLLMELRTGQYCEASCDLLAAATRRLGKFKHSHAALDHRDVENAVRSAELSLAAVLSVRVIG